jgi:hypothetical protein
MVQERTCWSFLDSNGVDGKLPFLLRLGGGTGKGGACVSPLGGSGGLMLAMSMRLRRWPLRLGCLWYMSSHELQNKCWSHCSHLINADLEPHSAHLGPSIRFMSVENGKNEKKNEA